MYKRQILYFEKKGGAAGMSGFIIGLAVIEFIALIVVFARSRGKALEALGVSAILWAAAWLAVFAGLAVPVSYTHLDVYKRQPFIHSSF